MMLNLLILVNFSILFNLPVQEFQSINYKNIQGAYDYQMNEIEDFESLFNQYSRIIVLEGHCTDCLITLSGLSNTNAKSVTKKTLICIRADTEFDFKSIIRTFCHKNPNLYFIHIKAFDDFFIFDKVKYSTYDTN